MYLSEIHHLFFVLVGKGTWTYNAALVWLYYSLQVTLQAVLLPQMFCGQHLQVQVPIITSIPPTLVLLDNLYVFSLELSSLC